MALSSCHGASVEELLKGEVDLSLSSATEIEVKSGEAVSAFDDYRFMFSGVDGYGSSEYYTFGEVLMPMEWYFGLYTMKAESCTEEEAEKGYGCIRYAGESSTFAVVNDQVASVSVMCNVANCRVNVKFDDSMYEAFSGFKLVVSTVTAPPEEEEGDAGDGSDADAPFIPETDRTLEFDPINPLGYYNISEEPLNMIYTLYVVVDGATEYIESVSGYFQENGVNAIISPADGITFNVKYTGDPVVSPNIKFIVEGERKSVQNNITLGDYNQGQVQEDE